MLDLRGAGKAPGFRLCRESCLPNRVVRGGQPLHVRAAEGEGRADPGSPARQGWGLWALSRTPGTPPRPPDAVILLCDPAGSPHKDLGRGLGRRPGLARGGVQPGLRGDAAAVMLPQGQRHSAVGTGTSLQGSRNLQGAEPGVCSTGACALGPWQPGGTGEVRSGTAAHTRAFRCGLADPFWRFSGHGPLAAASWSEVTATQELCSPS